VDEILELAPGRSVKAVMTLGAGEELFQDHFPGFPVVPGVLLTEMMAQAAGKCLLAEDPARGRPMLAQIKSATFRSWVRPDQQIMMLADIRSCRPEFAIAACRAEVDGRPVCSAELMFSFQPNSEFVAGYRDEVLERFLARTSGKTPGQGR